MLSYQLLAAILILIVTLISVIIPFKAHRHPKHHHLLDLGDAFASGVFLGAALFHLLPEASHYFSDDRFPAAGFLCAAGFILLLFLERLSLSTQKNNRTAAIPYILALVIMVHSLIEGMVLGVNTEIATLSIIFLAVIAHKSSESFALSAALVKNFVSLKNLFILIALFAFMTPIGILIGSAFSPYMFGQKGIFLTACFNAFAAGTFLYMSTLHHISHHQRLHEAESMTEFFCLVAGLILMGLVR
jgi:zinc transporter 1/2/3